VKKRKIELNPVIGRVEHTKILVIMFLEDIGNGLFTEKYKKEYF
jgi:hypothetical protein